MTTSVPSSFDTVRLRAQRHEFLLEAVHLAAAICDAPEAMVLLRSTSPKMFAAVHPEMFGQRMLEPSFCAHVMQQKGFAFVQDAKTDNRFSRDSLVSGRPGYRMFCGLPLHDASNACVGTLCVLDTRPRQILDFQQRGLLLLGHTLQFRLAALDVHSANAAQMLSGQRMALNPAFLPELLLERLDRSDSKPVWLS